MTDKIRQAAEAAAVEINSSAEAFYGDWKSDADIIERAMQELLAAQPHGCQCVCHEYPEHGNLQDALEAMRWHQREYAKLLAAQPEASASVRLDGETHCVSESPTCDCSPVEFYGEIRHHKDCSSRPAPSVMPDVSDHERYTGPPAEMSKLRKLQEDALDFAEDADLRKFRPSKSPTPASEEELADARKIIERHLEKETKRIGGATNAVTVALEKLRVDIILEQSRIAVKPIVDAEISAENRTKSLQLDSASSEALHVLLHTSYTGEVRTSIPAIRTHVAERVAEATAELRAELESSDRIGRAAGQVIADGLNEIENLKAQQAERVKEAERQAQAAEAKVWQNATEMIAYGNDIRTWAKARIAELEAKR